MENYHSVFYPNRPSMQFGATDYISSGIGLLGDVASGFFSSQTARYQSQSEEAQAEAQAAIAAIAAGDKPDYTSLLLGGGMLIAGSLAVYWLMKRRKRRKG